MLKAFPPKLRGVLILSLLCSSILLTLVSCGGGGTDNITPTPNPTLTIPPLPSTTLTINTLIDELHTWRQNSYTAIRQIQELSDQNLLPHGQGIFYNIDYGIDKSYYQLNVENYFNKWIDNLINEVSYASGEIIINTTSGDTQLENTAITNNEVFVMLAQRSCENYGNSSSVECNVSLGTRQGSYMIANSSMVGDPPEIESFEKSLGDALKEKVNELLGKIGDNLQIDPLHLNQLSIEGQLKQVEWDDWNVVTGS